MEQEAQRVHSVQQVQEVLYQALAVPFQQVNPFLQELKAEDQSLASKDQRVHPVQQVLEVED